MFKFQQLALVVVLFSSHILFAGGTYDPNFEYCKSANDEDVQYEVNIDNNFNPKLVIIKNEKQEIIGYSRGDLLASYKLYDETILNNQLQGFAITESKKSHDRFLITPNFNEIPLICK